MAKYSKEQRPPPTPKARKAWDVPLAPANGDKKREDIFRAIGCAMDCWNNIENLCGALFADLNEFCVAGSALARAYGSVVTFKGRADMIGAAAEIYFYKYPHPGEELRFKHFMDMALGFSARRNEIAHGMIARYRWFVPARTRGKGVGYVLGPPFFMTNKRLLKSTDGSVASLRMKPTYVYSSAEIYLLVAGFSKLYEHVRNLHHHLFRENWDRQLALHKKSGGRSPHPSTSFGHIDRPARKRPPRASRK